MKAVIVLVALVGAVVADIGIGYRYPVPQTSYGVPVYQSSGGSAGVASSSSGGSLQGQGLSGYRVQSGGYQGLHGIGQTQQSGYQGVGSYQGAGLVSSNAGAQGGYKYLSPASQVNYATDNSRYLGNYQQSNVNQPGYQYQNSYKTASQYQASVAHQYQEYYKQAQQQPAQVFKHFYVHAAPEEPEVPRFHQAPVLPPPQKHYKIIFIKTPSQAVAAPQILPVPQQNEEKTIVYVLVKKPEELPNVPLPKLEQKPPTKPEVYFIKYNNKEGSQAVINNIVSDYNKGSSDSSGSYSSQGTDGSVGSNVYSGTVGQNVEGGSQLLGFSNSGDYASQQVSGGGSTQLSNANVGGASSVYEGSSSSSALAQNGLSSGTVQNYEGFNSLPTSQGVPHESYGPPQFKLR